MVKGVEALERRFARIPENIRRAAIKPIEKHTRIMVAHMENLVPVEEGDLKRSIRWSWKEGGRGQLRIGHAFGKAYGYVGVTVSAGNENTMVVTKSTGKRWQNARLQEFGTTHHRPNPFFYVVWRAQRKSIKSAITRAVRKAIKDS